MKFIDRLLGRTASANTGSSDNAESRRIRRLIAQLKDKERALEANDELKKCAKAAVPEMLDALGDKSLEGWLVPLLGLTGDKRVLEPLRKLVESGKGQIRNHAVVAIMDLGISDPTVISTLIKALDDEITQFNSVYALNDLGPESAREALKRIAETTQNVGLASACKAIFLRLDGDIEGIAQMMKDDNWQVCFAAVNIIKATNNEKVRAILAEAARSAPQEVVRSEAKRALTRMNETMASAEPTMRDPHARLASDSAAERRDAAQALAYGLKASPDPKRDLDALLKAMTDSDPDVRMTTRTALIDDDEAIRLIVEFYRDSVASDIRRASLAGRILGVKVTEDHKIDMVQAHISKLLYGLDTAFVSCACAFCGAMNKGIPVPPRGRMMPYYGQEDEHGAYAVPVLCDKCAVVFYVSWDSDPR